MIIGGAMITTIRLRSLILPIMEAFYQLLRNQNHSSHFSKNSLLYQIL